MVEQQKSRTRQYRLGRRQASVDETRERITVAAFELHSEVGPARTTISAIAERAGVQRHTVYNHFPDLSSLFEACTAHGMKVMRVPEPETWRAIEDRVDRLRHGLDELYAVYRANARAIGTILRDMPLFADVGGDDAFADRMDGLFAALAEGWAGDEAAQSMRSAAIGHALRFETWRSLTAGGLNDEQAREMMVELVTRAGAAAG